MTNRMNIVFVDRVPATLRQDVLYICIECNVTVHLCACGCGEKVILPIHPDFWKITYDGETVSLSPSIGNFQYTCRSHYFIRNNRIIWCDDREKGNEKFKKRVMKIFSKLCFWK